MTAPTQAIVAASPAPSGRFRALHEYLRRPLAVIAALFLLVVIIAVSLAPVIAPFDPLAQDLPNALSGPSATHPLGADQLGRDVLSRLLWGGRTTLIGVIEALVVAFVAGVVFGLIAGFVGRAADTVTSRVTDVVMAIPAIVLLLMVYSLSNNNADAGMLTLGVLSVPSILRVTRSAARGVRGETFVLASEVVGMGKVRILARHVLPNIWGPIIVNTSITAAVILGVQGGLNYLNLGVTPPAPTWGGMVAEAATSLQLQPWLIVPSGLVIALTIAAFILIADGLRDATSAARGRSAARASASPRETFPTAPTAPDGPLLQVRNLAVRFGQLEVVRRVDLDIAAGQTLGIVGESGCGKSVTASAILDSLGPGSTVDGVIAYDGVDIVAASRRARAAVRGSGIAYISQDPMVALDPSFTVGAQVRELIRTHDRGLGRAATRRRMLELLTQVGLPDPASVARRYPHQLSGGMAQRVSIAGALAGRPRILIADEPTTALDVTIQGEILSLLRRLRDEEGMAIVLITHDLGVVADLCDRVAVMYAGEIVETADVADLFARPAHPYSRALLDANPVLTARGEQLAAIPGVVPSPADWPRGCHFFDRCPLATDECAVAAIPLVLVDDDHDSRCIHVDRLTGVA